MKRLLVLAAMVAAAAAAPAAADPPAFDKAEGACAFTCDPVIPGFNACNAPRVFEFSFSAIQLGFGPHARGFIRRTLVAPFPGGESRGRVTCLNVIGNAAVFGGFLETGSPGQPFFVWVIDNGPPGSSPPDLMSLFWVTPFVEEVVAIPPGAPFLCPQPFGPLYHP